MGSRRLMPTQKDGLQIKKTKSELEIVWWQLKKAKELDENLLREIEKVVVVGILLVLIYTGSCFICSPRLGLVGFAHEDFLG